MRIQQMIDDDTKETYYVNWDKNKVLRKGLATGKLYAVYFDNECKDFWFWMKRKEITKYHLRACVNS